MPRPRRTRRDPPLALVVLLILVVLFLWSRAEVLLPLLTGGPPTPGATEAEGARDRSAGPASDTVGARGGRDPGAPDAPRDADADGARRGATRADRAGDAPGAETGEGAPSGAAGAGASSARPATGAQHRAPAASGAAPATAGGTVAPPTPSGDRAPLLDALLAADDLAAVVAERTPVDGEDAVLAAAQALQLGGLATPALQAWLAEHDPLRPQRAALLARLAELALADLDAALARRLPLVGVLREEEAAALLAAAGDDTPPAGGAADTLAALRARHAELRARLHADRDLARELLARGARPPDDAPLGSTLAERRWAREDRARREQGGAATLERGRLTLVSTLDAAHAARVLEGAVAALDAAEARWPGAGREPLELRVVATRRQLEQAAQGVEPEVPVDALAFLDPGAPRVVALDPRFSGEPLAELPGRLAREIARWTLRRAHAGGAPLPAWLEEGWARDFEGWAPTRDGAHWYAAEPWALTERTLLDMTTAGPGRADLDALVAQRPSSELAGAACWSFVRHLETARTADDEPLFAEELALLVRSRRDGLDLEPDVELRLRFTQSDAQRAASVTSPERLRMHWWSAVQARRAASLAPAPAAPELWDALDGLLRRRRLEAAAEELRRLSPLRPLDAALRARRRELAERRADRDGRLLEALLLARCAEGEQAAAAWDDAAGVNAGLGGGLRERRAAGLAALDALLARYASAGREQGARLLLDRLAALAPAEPAFTARRASLAEASPADDLALHVHPLLHPRGRGVTTEDELWRREPLALEARAEDRAAPTTLHALWPLRAPYTLRARVQVERPSRLRSSDEHRAFGFTFGGSDQVDPGQWALLVAPGGRVSLGVRGTHEWPARAVGVARPGASELALFVDRDGLRVVVDGRELLGAPAGVRPLDGQLGALSRQASATVTELAVDLRPRRDPSRHWALGGPP